MPLIINRVGSTAARSVESIVLSSLLPKGIYLLTIAVARVGISFLTGEALAIPSPLSEADA
jgi:hypothetical protein